MEIDILSLFPEYFTGPFDVSMIKKAREKGILTIHLRDIRDFGEGKHRRVDDRPFGGGPGMVLMPKPVSESIRSVKKEDSYVIYLSPQGTLLNAAVCERLAKKPHLILVCGHYEGLDQRVIEKEVDEEISIGDYVLTNGCIAAIALLDAVGRFVPGVLGHEAAAAHDSFQEGIFESPQFTRPVDFEGMRVPDELRSGNHALIQKWQRQEALKKTYRVRPDLISGSFKGEKNE